MDRYCPHCGGKLTFYSLVRCIECTQCSTQWQSLYSFDREFFSDPRRAYAFAWWWIRFIADCGVHYLDFDYGAPFELVKAIPARYRRAAARSLNMRREIEKISPVEAWRMVNDPNWLPF